ncbi:MAG: thiol-disulfide oxidoreductase DCC family protein [Luteibaculaceae bacterium]
MSTKIIFFDGVCNLCNGSVRFIMKHNKAGNLFFASLQSPLGSKALEFTNLPPSDLKSLLFYDGEKFYTRSRAVFKIASYLDYPYKLLSVLRFLPPKLSDVFYNFVARNRYKWFGKLDNCKLPSKNEESRFLGDILIQF